MEKNLALILAGGSGTRFGKQEPKQFVCLAGKLVIEHTLDCFEYHPAIHSIYIVSHPDFINKTQKIISQKNYEKVRKIIPGGNTRQDSSRIGVEAIDESFENILIHDAVRPLLSKEIIDSILKKMEVWAAVTLAVPNSDTIVEVSKENIIRSIPERNSLRRVQTPQAFKLELIQQAHRLAREKNLLDASDDCSLVVHFGLADIFVVQGSHDNIKITRSRDIQVVELVMKEK